MEQKRREAIISEDKATLDALLSDDLVHTHTNGQIDTKQEFLRELGKTVRFLSIEPIAQRVIPHGDCAIVSATVSIVVRVNATNENIRLTNRVLSVWTRETGAWRQGGYQVTKIV
ncbi:MAG: nuclear transport factor 2 family protein [Hyphomonadaceae bacterium]